MDLLEHWVEYLHLSHAVTVLLVLMIVLVKNKLCEHDRMYLWYIGQLAIAQQNRPPDVHD